MTEAALSGSAAPRTYGNWRRVQSVGIANLGLAGTIVLFVGLIFVVLGLMFSLVVSLGAAVLTVAAIGPLMVRDRHNRNLFQRATARIAWARGVLAASTSTAPARWPGCPKAAAACLGSWRR